MTKTDISPLPEAIDGRQWTVQEGTGSCDTVSRILGVPMDDSPASRFVRNHELGHARITPKSPAFRLCAKFGVSMDAMQVCEDLRVHRYLVARGISMCGVLHDAADADQMVSRISGSERLLAAALVASMHTDDHPRLLSAIDNLVEDGRIEKGRREHLARMAVLINDRMTLGRGLDRPIGFRNGTVPAARLFDAFFPTAGTPAPQLPVESLHVPCRGRPVGWGDMRVERLPASQSRPIPAAARSRSFCDHGAVLAASHRLPVDGRVFLRHRRQRGGTVLIDGSGSMCFSPAELERITTAAPQATVAIYGGRNRSGTLTVVASRGRMASPAALRSAARGSGNVVDGPALRWLAGQSEPRVWVSDGQVTGIGDIPSPDLVVDAIRICRHGRITRVEKTESGCHLLAKTPGGSR